MFPDRLHRARQQQHVEDRAGPQVHLQRQLGRPLPGVRDEVGRRRLHQHSSPLKTPFR